MTFSDAFEAGTSYFGIGDLETFQAETHKFESRYDQTLIGPWPESKQLYHDRSPINFVDRISCPVLDPPGRRGPGRAAGPGRGDRRRALGEAAAARVSAVPGRGPRLPRRREHHPQLRGRAVVLRPGLRLHAGRRDRADRGRVPGRAGVDPGRGGPRPGDPAARRDRATATGAAERRPSGRSRPSSSCSSRRPPSRCSPAGSGSRTRSCSSSAGSRSGSSRACRRSSSSRSSSSCCSCRRSCSGPATSPRSATSSATSGRSRCCRSGSSSPRSSPSRSSPRRSCRASAGRRRSCSARSSRRPMPWPRRSVFQRLGVPRRVVTILEGESLVNDATALVAYRVALIAASTGTFSLGERRPDVRRRRRRRRRLRAAHGHRDLVGPACASTTRCSRSC